MGQRKPQQVANLMWHFLMYTSTHETLKAMVKGQQTYIFAFNKQRLYQNHQKGPNHLKNLLALLILTFQNFAFSTKDNLLFLAYWHFLACFRQNLI